MNTANPIIFNARDVMLQKRVSTGLGFIVFICLSMITCSLWAKSFAPLAAEEAFILSAHYQAPTLTLRWQIAPNYYLYRDKIKVNVASSNALALTYPQGELKYAEDRGRYEVYKNSVTLSAHIAAANTATTITVLYQGCSDNGFCYPPMVKTFRLEGDTLLASDKVAPSFLSLLTNQNQIAALFQSPYWPVTFLIFLGLGLLLAFTPCVLPMIPILTSIIVGQSKSVTTRKAFFLSLMYVLGMALTYALAGMGAALLGNSLQLWLQKPLIIIGVSLLFIVLAFSLFDIYHLRLPHRLQQLVAHLPHRFQGGSYIGVFMMGAISILIVSPCVTAPLVGVLMYIGQTGDVVLGAGALFAIGLGMGLPLLLIGVSAGRWLPRRGPWMELVKMAFGVLMLVMAVWLFSRLLPMFYTVLVWSGFLMLLSLGLALYKPKYYRRYHLNRLLAFVLSLAGLGLLLSYNVKPESASTQLSAVHSEKFIIVKNIAALNKRLHAAVKSGRPVLIDYYADWCESCLSMERHVFANQQVLSQLTQAHFVLLRIDLSANTADDEALLAHFEVTAPPTILFFDRKGQENLAQRVVGELSLSEFLARLAEINNTL